MNKVTNTLYFRWLCKQIENRGAHTYRKLFEILMEREFYWSVPNDDNRIEDGIKLREIFAQSHPPFLPDSSSLPCSILEMLIALSYRMENILSERTEGDRSRQWFWEMIHNLGLDQFHDENFYMAKRNGVIDHILNTFMNRTYDRYGHGGLFPLKKTAKNSAKIEIWYQLMQYLDENYAD